MSMARFCFIHGVDSAAPSVDTVRFLPGVAYPICLYFTKGAIL